MTGKAYYLATLGDWRRHSARFTNSHWIALDNAAAAAPLLDSTRILALIEADEGAHLALEDDAAFEALPHPLAQEALSKAALAALARIGVKPGASTFGVAEAAARVHPLMRHRVF